MVLVQNHFCISICISINRAPITNPSYYDSKRYYLFIPNTKVKLFLTHDLLASQEVGKMSMSKLLQSLLHHMTLPNPHFSFTLLPVFQTDFSTFQES